MKNLPYIIKEDRVRIIGEEFKGTKFENKPGYVTRTSGDQACVVVKDVWDHGVWFDISDLKRTKRYKKKSETVKDNCIIQF